jgi:protein TonB
MEQEAYFSDERTTWTKYLIQNNRFDSIYQLLTENTQSWTVYVQFVVNREGAVEVTGIKGDSLLNPLFAAEIIRLFQQSPKWEAAEQNGRKIKSFRNQKLGFVVPADEKEEPARKPATFPENSIPQKTLPDGSNASQFFI